MNIQCRPWLTPSIAGIALLLTLVLAPSEALARDRTRPTTPTNLRVTGTTAYRVSLVWNPSTDNSGNFSYRVRHSWGYEVTLPRTQTTHTWTGNLEAGRTYSFWVYAVDAAGNRSSDSNTVTVRLPFDTTPPATPTIGVTDVGPRHVSLAWSGSDDGPFVWFLIFSDGVMVQNLTRETSGTFHLLEPETTYTFTAQARDFGGNLSPVSQSVTVTTEAVDPSDNVPPTTPTNLRASDLNSGDGEVIVRWTGSTDSVTPQAHIRYDVYINGVLGDVRIGADTRASVYGNVGEFNTVEVIAVDEAGNESPAASLTFLID